MNLPPIKRKKAVSGKKRDKKRPDKNPVKRPVIFYILILACAAVIAAGVIIFMLVIPDSGEPVDQSEYSIAYVVKVAQGAESLSVDINFDIIDLSRDNTIMLYKGLMTDDMLEYTGCTDDTGREVAFIETPDLVSIGPIIGDAKSVRFSYDVRVGYVSPGIDLFEIPYAQGCMLDDLIVFSGEYAILMPFLDPETFDKMEKYVNSVSFEFIVPEGLDPIIPFRTPLDRQFSLVTDKPDWEFFNTISKSAFCFGRFESYDYDGLFGDALVYIDKQALHELSQYSLDALAVFLDNYTYIFDEPLGSVPIVLLRNHPADNSVITGGAGSACSAISINLRIAEDFRALSNMVFHTFFDSKIKPLNLRYKGYTWIYRGLAEYYVNRSINWLPGYIVEAYSIGRPTHPVEYYLRYLYFSLKEPGFLALSPANELTGMYTSQEEFYMSVKVPLLIDVINLSIGEKTGQEYGFLRTLVKNGGSSDPLDVEKMLKGVCGPDYTVISDYLSGKALIPNYNGFDINGDYYDVDFSRDYIMILLDQDEQKYAYFFSLDKINYPYAPLFLLNEEAFMAEVAARGIRYNSDLIQGEVEKFSSILHRLLLQYAMWASVSGIDDVTELNIYKVLTQPENWQKWYELYSEIGIEYEVYE